jgi:hypothetical protein
MKQTAVEWLFDNLDLSGGGEAIETLNKAKEMEKEQIINAYNTSFSLRDKPYSTADKYYNETFKSE